MCGGLFFQPSFGAEISVRFVKTNQNEKKKNQFITMKCKQWIGISVSLKVTRRELIKRAAISLSVCRSCCSLLN